MTSRWLMTGLIATIAGGCAAAPSGLRPADLTPVTWMDAPQHPPIEIVRDGQPRAVVYVADPRGKETFVEPRAMVKVCRSGSS